MYAHCDSNRLCCLRAIFTADHAKCRYALFGSSSRVPCVRVSSLSSPFHPPASRQLNTLGPIHQRFDLVHAAAALEPPLTQVLIALL